MTAHSTNMLNQHIKSQGAMYYLRATPFTDHSEFNYDGRLNEQFFFENLYSGEGMCNEYFESIRDSLENHKYKTVLLTGNQGCGKTTFAHKLKYICKDQDFLYFDFDQDTSHPTLEEYIERLSNYLHSLINNPQNTQINSKFYDLYKTNEALISGKINAKNNVGNFYEQFKDLFLLQKSSENRKNNFITFINKLFFNQILSLIVLWHLAKISCLDEEIRPLVFCLDNLDVLVNQEIIECFFKEYFLFIRNIDGIINNLEDHNIQSRGITYNSMFCIVLVCRQHTWARVKKHYPHDNAVVHVSTHKIDITDAFTKSEILAKRERYVEKNKDFFGEFLNDVLNVRSILNDLDVTEKNSHTIYDLFNDDYRQCVLTVEDIIKDNPTLIKTYTEAKKKLPKGSQGLRGIIYRVLFERFKGEGVFDDIGVLDIDDDHPLVSNARLLLNYLNYHTYHTKRCIQFSKIVADFDGIISKDDIDNSLVAMFTQGYKSTWNELIAFNEIGTEEVSTCVNTEIMITPAGHEYLDFIATHFEFFSTRVTKRRYGNGPALFSDESVLPYCNPQEEFLFNGESFHFEYVFEETIFRVMEIVERCCGNMTKFYHQYMKERFPNKVAYLRSPYVFGETNVLHGERIIHTHIRYIDNYRLYLLGPLSGMSQKKKIKINEKLVRFIAEYIEIGKRFPFVLTGTSTNHLFPAFEKRIKAIQESGFTDFQAINIKRR